LDIGVALRDDAIERGDDILEGFHRLELCHNGLGTGKNGLRVFQQNPP
jgi:hypothetical protein